MTDLAEAKTFTSDIADLVSAHWQAAPKDPERIALLHAVLNKLSRVNFRLDAVEREVKRDRQEIVERHE